VANTYKSGTSVKVSAIFQDVDALAFDPDVVLCSVMSPDGAETVHTYLSDASLVRDSEGHFHLWIVSPDQEGTWTYGFKGDGDVAVTNCGEFEIEACGLTFA
jgi:hypothetical protein